MLSSLDRGFIASPGSAAIEWMVSAFGSALGDLLASLRHALLPGDSMDVLVIRLHVDGSRVPARLPIRYFSCAPLLYS